MLFCRLVDQLDCDPLDPWEPIIINAPRDLLHWARQGILVGIAMLLLLWACLTELVCYPSRKELGK